MNASNTVEQELTKLEREIGEAVAAQATSLPCS